jgi:hypothetical protein
MTIFNDNLSLFIMIEFGLIEPDFVVYILSWCVQWII